MKRKTDILVGFIVLLVVAATIVAVAWVKQADFGKRERDVVARFRDVGNARVGNAVVVRGVVGGRVQAIELAPDGWVIVHLRVNPSVVFPADPVVLLNESSLFGEWQATVIERSALPHDDVVRREVAEAGRDGRTLPGATLPGIGKLTAVAGQIAGDVASVAERVEVAFDEQAARELRASIKNVSDLSSVMSKVVRTHAADLDVLSGQLQTAVASLNETANTVKLTATRIDSATTSPEARSIVSDLAIASTELRHTSGQIRELSGRFASTQTKLDAAITNGDSVLAKINAGTGSLGLLVNDPTMYRQTDSLLTELRALVTDFKANPKKYVSVRIF
ncbi:MAG TPA: MlaD family protein [Gemmatimonadaceae bacterium]|nr:MlaD family protein [Gemmatimonadaceae bacterium]